MHHSAQVVLSFQDDELAVVGSETGVVGIVLQEVTWGGMQPWIQ